MMRLAYVDPQSYHGLAKYDAAYLKGLLDAGFDGEVLFYGSSLLDRPLPEAVRARALFGYSRRRSAVAKLVSYTLSVFRLLAEALRRPADIYHFQWFKFPLLDLVVVLALRKLSGARIVFTAHNVVPHGETHRRHRCLGRIYRSVDAIVVHHAETAAEIAERFGAERSRFAVQRHGTIRLEPRSNSRHAKGHAKAIDDFVARHQPCFLFMGRGARYKGLDILLNAWPRAARAASGCPGLIIIGTVDRELREQARRTARQETSVLLIDEHVCEGDLHHAVKRSDVAVLPHRRVSQSGVLLSVLGLRKPVLVSAQPGLLEPFEVARVGWQFDGSEAGLAERLAFLAAHPEAVAEVRADDAAWQAVEKAYAWKTIGAQSIELYQRLLARAAHRVRPPC